MGDRTWLQLNFLRKDLPEFKKALREEDDFWEQDNGDEVEIRALITESNVDDYIWSLSNAELTFSGEHGSGDEYGPMCFACYKGNLVECYSDWENRPVVTVGPDGKINERELEDVKKYYEIIEKIRIGGD